MTIDPGLRRLALRTLLGAFGGRTGGGDAIGAGVFQRTVHTAPEWAVDLVADGLAGYCLFGYNIGSPDQVARLTAQLRDARDGVLIATDEEGGDVTRLSHATGSPYPGNAALGAVGDLGLTRRVYQAIGRDLVRAGININLAPTVDVNVAADNPIIGTRSFGADPVKVAGHAAAAVVGLQSVGVAACAKHFPGHGATVDDSHHRLPTVDIDEDLLRSRELPPFAAVVAADAKAIMTAHIRVPAMTGDDPATFSRTMLLDLLRGEFGFTGVIMTDAIEMAGAAAVAGGIEQAAVRALAAGSDLLCIGSDVDGELIERIATAIVLAIGSGDLARSRVEDAAARNAELSSWITGTAGRTVEEDLGYAAAARAIRIEGSVSGFDAPLVVQLDARHSMAEGPVPWGLKPHVNGTPYVHVASGETSVPALVAEAAGRPIVIVGRHTHRSEESRRLVEALAASHPTAVVEMGWPASWRPVGARAFVTTYGASYANGHAAASALGLTH